MRKLSMSLIALVLSFSVILPVQAAPVSWDVTGTGTNPYTLTFTGEGLVDLESETTLVFEGEVTGKNIDIAKTPVVTFTAETAPTINIVAVDQSKNILVEFGRVVTEEPAAEKPTAEEPVTEEPTTEESQVDPATEEPATEEPVTEEPTKEEPTKEKPVKATTGTISGTVWYDENMDGIRQSGELLLDDIPVLLLNHDEDVVDEVYTKEGRYTFSNLKPGEYDVEMDGFDMGYYYNSPQNVGDDRLIDSDLDEEDGYLYLRLKAGQTAEIDAGLYGAEEEEDFSNLLLVTNFFDADANQRPGYTETGVPATYTVTDTITGEDVYKETVGANEAMMIELEPGTYSVKTEVKSGYLVKAMHHLDLDTLLDFEDFSGAITKADMKAMAEDQGEELDEEFPELEEFMKLFKRKPVEATFTMTEDTLGFFLAAEVVRAESVEQAKPTPVKAKTEQTTDVTRSTKMSGTLPQAGEETPFPFAATGAGLAVVGLWFLLRRNG
ncbi:SdrD B-like domain-containing protein [Exiguobacterium sp. S90]|uniref:SdrD B-like domain-containing protein n=1 Tax=Exiguobacterium sp. S90 TaxID=1221231 RepID=UPI001BEB1C93|nr:SdrD B-like domain-containing protein [Exiguobacterium sp. S90]